MCNEVSVTNGLVLVVKVLYRGVNIECSINSLFNVHQKCHRYDRSVLIQVLDNLCEDVA